MTRRGISSPRSRLIGQRAFKRSELSVLSGEARCPNKRNGADAARLRYRLVILRVGRTKPAMKFYLIRPPDSDRSHAEPDPNVSSKP